MIGFLVFGFVVGVLARLVVPGRQHLTIWMTLLLGWLGRRSDGERVGWLARRRSKEA